MCFRLMHVVAARDRQCLCRSLEIASGQQSGLIVLGFARASMSEGYTGSSSKAERPQLCSWASQGLLTAVSFQWSESGSLVAWVRCHCMRPNWLL